MTTELWALSAEGTSSLVKAGKVSALEVTQNAITRMEAVNPAINAVVDPCSDRALAAAANLDKKIKRGEPCGLLAGVPVTIKVNTDMQGYATTNGLVLQKDRIAHEDSPVVTNLQNADAIVIGRTNAPAFSLRWFTRNRLHGATLNPVNPTLTPGGSSGGAAAAVAAGIGALAHGTDIAGSIRYPAYACGVHGIRPSLGRVPVYNASGPDRYIGGQLMAVSGPLARTIGDLRLGLRAMSAYSDRDPWWVPAPQSSTIGKRKAALCINPEGWEVAPEVEKAVREAAALLQDAGWEVTETTCPSFRDAARLNLTLWMAEMARAGTDLIDKENDPDANFVFKHLQQMHNPPDANGLLDAMQERASLTREWQLFLAQYPVVLCPPSAQLPFANHADVESTASLERIIEAQLIQIALPLTGLPGLVLSTGLSGQSPVGVQMIANRFREDVLFDVAELIETTTGLVEPVNPT